MGSALPPRGPSPPRGLRSLGRPPRSRKTASPPQASAPLQSFTRAPSQQANMGLLSPPLKRGNRPPRRFRSPEVSFPFSATPAGGSHIHPALASRGFTLRPRAFPAPRRLPPPPTWPVSLNRLRSWGFSLQRFPRHGSPSPLGAPPLLRFQNPPRRMDFARFRGFLPVTHRTGRRWISPLVAPAQRSWVSPSLGPPSCLGPRSGPLDPPLDRLLDRHPRGQRPFQRSSALLSCTSGSPPSPGAFPCAPECQRTRGSARLLRDQPAPPRFLSSSRRPGRPERNGCRTG